MNLTGNTIFITGGGSGIGRGLAEALHRLGNEVIISGRRRDRINTVISANPGMKAIELDITDPASIERAAERLIGEYPDLNVLSTMLGSWSSTEPPARSMTRSRSPPSRPT